MPESRESLTAKLAAAKAKSSSLKSESRAIRNEIAMITGRLKVAEKRLEELVGGPCRRGFTEIQLAEALVSEIERFLADCELPAVVWSKTDGYATRSDWVVAKRDAKTISVRPRGSLENCERYRLDGTPADARRKWRIDMERTK